MHEGLADLDAAGLLAACSTAVRARRLAEVEDLRVLAQWAAVHSSDPTRGPDGAFARTVGNVLVQVGGEGTPQVQDFSLGEIALARGTGVMATRNALADVLDLIHRLPRTWEVAQSGEAEVWVARRVAKLSRHLSLECVGVVDAAIAAMLVGEAAGRVLTVAEAKVIEADPEGHDRRLAEQRKAQYVAFTRTDEAGLRTVIARVKAGDAVWIEATVHRVAQILTPHRPEATVGEVRAEAFGYLARPAELLALLLEHTDQPPHEPAPAPAEPDADQEPDAAAVPHRAVAFPADLLQALRAADFSTWRPQCVFYLHLCESVLHGAPGVARVEGLGPVTLDRLAELVGQTDLVIKPVIDLSDRIRHTAYEHPESLKERVHLTTLGDYWPYATSTSRAVDYDHPIPYRDPDQGGPPGQTGTHNSGPLGRRHHRWKTHASFQARQSGHGRYAWLTPHGLGFVVDHHGTRPVDPDHARMIINAPPGVDIYPLDTDIQLDLRPS